MMKDESGEYNVFDLKVHITTTTELTEEQIVVKIINAIQDGNTWILISPDKKDDSSKTDG